MHHRSILARAALAACALVLASAAAAAPTPTTDNVLSGNIKEADGTSGQDTNAGSGVKSGHIQDGAVTAPKLAPAAVGAAAIADGAVTAAKLGGQIPASKIDRTGLDADSLDGYQAGDFSPIGHDHVLSEIHGMDAYRKKQANVLVVAQDGTGDFTSLVDAIASLGGNPTEASFLVKVMPGSYDIGATTLVVPRFVHVEGSGAGVTFLTGSTPGTWDRKTACLKLSFYSTLRSLSLSCNAGVTQPYVTAAYVEGYTTVSSVNLSTVGVENTGVSYVGFGAKIENSTIMYGASGSATRGIGLYCGQVDCSISVIRSEITTGGGSLGYGIELSGYARAEISDSLVYASSSTGPAHAAHVTRGYLTIRNTRLVASGSPDSVGVYAWGDSTVKVDGSVISAPAPATMVGSVRPIFIGNTRIEGTGAIGAGVKCVGTYSDLYEPVACPR